MKFIIVERDTYDPFSSDGAIVFEQKTRLSDEEVLEKARKLANDGKYGKVWVVDVNPAEAVLVEVDQPLRELVELDDFDLFASSIAEKTGLRVSSVVDCLINSKPLPYRITGKMPF